MGALALIGLVWSHVRCMCINYHIVQVVSLKLKVYYFNLGLIMIALKFIKQSFLFSVGVTGVLSGFLYCKIFTTEFPVLLLLLTYCYGTERTLQNTVMFMWAENCSIKQCFRQAEQLKEISLGS